VGSLQNGWKINYPKWKEREIQTEKGKPDEEKMERGLRLEAANEYITSQGSWRGEEIYLWQKKKNWTKSSPIRHGRENKKEIARG